MDLHNEILTVQDLAGVLKMSRSQIYEMTRTRGRVRPDLPLPVLRINGKPEGKRLEPRAGVERNESFRFWGCQKSVLNCQK